MHNLPESSENQQHQERMKTILKDLRTIFRAVQSHSKTVEKACGLSSAKLWMLMEINTTPGIRVSELAKRLTIHASTCSNMLDKLELKNLIVRDRSKSDQRTVHLYPSPQGKELFANAPRPAQGILSNALERLPQEQLLDLEKGLNALIKAIHNPDENAALLPIHEE